MSQVGTVTLSANGTFTAYLNNHRGERNIYSAYIGGTFGSGTVTATLTPLTGMTAIAIKDQSGSAVSLTSDGMFNFEAQSGGPKFPVLLTITLASSTSPTLKIVVNDGR